LQARHLETLGADSRELKVVDGGLAALRKELAAAGVEAK
jgi:hypothetical protein